jgi:hypothetical protein
MIIEDNNFHRAQLIFDAVEQPVHNVAQADCLIYTEKNGHTEPDKDGDAVPPMFSSVKVGRANTISVQFDEGAPYADVIRVLGKILENIKDRALKAKNFREQEAMEKTWWNDGWKDYRKESSFDLERPRLPGQIESMKKRFRKIIEEMETNAKARENGERPSKEVLEEIFGEAMSRTHCDTGYIIRLKADLESK